MKELSIEEKARAYDEALEKARKLCAYPTTKPFISDLQDLFPELKESEDDRIRGKLIELFHDTVSNDEIFSDYGLDKTEVIAWLEKQDEQKPINNIEPKKFKVGDWIVEPREGESDGLWHIDGIEDGCYWSGKCGCTIEYADKNFHLWTIEDAKDGDVLVASDGSIFIYKCQRDNSVVHYIAVTSCNDLAINENDYSWENKNACHPATQRQRDCLFQRIKEDGYEWNADTKVLNKVTIYE